LGKRKGRRRVEEEGRSFERLKRERERERERERMKNNNKIIISL
jgi:hypothetical protein